MKAGLILASVISSMIASFEGYAAPFAFKNMDARYVVKYDGIPIGNSETVLKIKNKNQYHLCINNRTTVPFLKGTVTECSDGMIYNQEIKPLHYNYFYQDKSQKQSLQIDFNWKQNLAIIYANKTQWKLPLLPHTQDKISYQLLLRKALSNDQKSFSFPVADGGKLKIYQFKVINTEILDTPWQKVNTIKLERLPMPDKEDITLWFMTDHDFIVAKAEQKKHIVNIGTAEIEYAQI